MTERQCKAERNYILLQQRLYAAQTLNDGPSPTVILQGWMIL